MEEKDIKKRLNELENSYSELNEQYQFLFESINDGAAILKPSNGGKDFVISDINQSVEEIEKIKKEEVLGKLFSEAFPRAHYNGLSEVFSRVWKTGKTESFPLLIKKDSEITNYHRNKIKRLPNGNLLVLYKDIQEFEKSKKALAESENRLKLALESTQIGMWDHNLKTGEVYRSKEWAEMLGYKKEEIDNHSKIWKELIHPDDKEKVKKTAQAHETSETDTFHVEHRLKTKDGNYKWILNWGKIIEKDENGNPARAVGTHLDIDKRKKAEEKLSELNATKDRLFSIIGHDLKNPLSDILGFSSLLTSNYSEYSPDKIKTFIGYIKQAAARMHDLLENLLRWSRLQREETPYRPEKIDINKLFAKIVSQFQTKADAKKIKLSYPEDEINLVHADRNMIETVLRNLISNALKYTEEEGAVSVFTTEGENHKMIVSVEDTGIGIKPNNINELFQADRSKSTCGTNGEKGTGLGLILCKEIIDIHNEDIWVESEPGKGSTFKFTLLNANYQN